MQARDFILERFSSLSPKLQDAAKFVVDHPNEVVTTSMRTLAERAGAQPATLVRLAQQLGYAGWPELKEAFADGMGLRSESYGVRAKGLAARGHDSSLLHELFGAHHHNLELTEAQCAPSLGEAAKLLKRAKAVFVAGFRASYPVAYSFAYGYRLFRNSVYLIDGQAGGLEMQTRPVEPGDAVVVISFAPYSSEALRVAEAAQAAGARLIAITDSSASPIALLAHVTVLFSADSPSFFPSIAAALAATEAVLEILVAQAGDATLQQIDRSEQQLFDSGAYLQAPRKRHAEPV